MSITAIILSALMAWSAGQVPADPDAVENRQIEVMIDQIPTQEGDLYVHLYVESQDAMRGQLSPLFWTIATNENGRAKVQFDQVPEGRYSILVFLDRNDNAELDRNWAGKPLESYGYSGLAGSYIGIPPFSEVSFDLRDRNQVVLVKMNMVDKKLPNISSQEPVGISTN